MLVVLLRLILVNKNKDLNYKDININKAIQNLIKKKNKFWILLIDIDFIFLANTNYLYKLEFAKTPLNINKEKKAKQYTLLNIKLIELHSQYSFVILSY